MYWTFYLYWTRPIQNHSKQIILKTEHITNVIWSLLLVCSIYFLPYKFYILPLCCLLLKCIKMLLRLRVLLLFSDPILRMIFLPHCLTTRTPCSEVVWVIVLIYKKGKRLSDEPTLTVHLKDPAHRVDSLASAAHSETEHTHCYTMDKKMIKKKI